MKHLGILFTTLMMIGALAQADSASLDAALLDGYRPVQVELTRDNYDGAKALVTPLAKSVQSWLEEKGTADAQTANVKVMAEGTDKMSGAHDIAELRSGFAVLSRGIVEFVRPSADLKAKWQLFFCPMAPEYGFWVQPMGEKLQNPYFGAEMLTCGTKKKWN